MNLDARLLRPEDVPRLRTWFEDPDTTRWLGDASYPALLLELTSQPGRWAFVITESQEPVALVDVEQDGESPTAAVVAIAVAPSRRRMGIGWRALNAVAARPELATVREFVGEVEVGNAAAERWVLAAGFERSGMAAERGFTRYVRRAHRDSR